MNTGTRRRNGSRIAGVLAALLAVPALLVAGATASSAAGSNTLTVKASEFAYKLSGSPKPGWTEIKFQNDGLQDHMLVALKLKKGVTAAQLKTAATSEDDSAFAKIALTGDEKSTVSGMPAVLGPKQQTTTLTELTAGHYGLASFVSAPDGAPDVAHGMVKVFDVKGSKSSLKPPQNGVVDLTLSDTAITIPSGSAPRTANVKVTNEGQAGHSFQLVKLNSGKTLADAYAYFNALINTGTADGDAPGTLVGGVNTVHPGGIADYELNLAAGHYGYLSTEGDSPDDDYSKGLQGEFDVK